MKPAFLLFLILPFLFQCNRTVYTSTDFPADYLSFGKGGGFTGEVSTFFLLPNGQVFSSSGLSADTLAYTQLKKRTANKLLKRFDSLRLDTLNFNHPGNKYTFVAKHSEDQTIWLTMGDPKMETPLALKNYYLEISEVVKAAAEKTE